MNQFWKKFISGEDNRLSWKFIFLIMFVCLLLFVAVFYSWYFHIFDFLNEWLGIGSASNGYTMIRYSSSVAVGGIVSSIAIFLIKNHNFNTTLESTKQQIKNQETGSNEEVFANAVKTLHNENNDKGAQAFALTELSRLKKSGKIDPVRTDNATRGVRLSDIIFRDLDITDCDFRKAIFTNTNNNVNFSGVGFIGVDFSGVDFSTSIFSDTNSFTVSGFPGTDFSGADLSKSDISFGDLGGGAVEEFDIDSMDFRSVKFDNPHFDNIDLYNSSFRNMKLKNVIFSRVSFMGNFTGALFKGVDFKDSNFINSDFKGAKYNQKTKFPPGFSPEEHGMINVS